MKRLEGKVAVITGAAQGIGAASAARLTSEGASAILIDVLPEGEATAAALRRDGREAIFVKMDVSDAAAWTAVIRDAEARFGGLDILVNNAAIAISANIDDVTVEIMRQVYEINFYGSFHGIKAALPAMRRRNGGSIINISSGQTRLIHDFACAYGASKAALTHLTKTTAVHCAQRGYNIRANTIHPGRCETAMLLDGVRKVNPALVSTLHHGIPMGRLGRPDEIAATVAYLASEDGSYVTAEEIYVDGGLVAV